MAAHEAGAHIHVMTFNILAPCYKRTGNGTEADLPRAWKDRLVRITQEIAKSDAEIVCLQEFWFDPTFRTLFEEQLQDKYTFHYKKRTGKKQDGVAILVEKNITVLHTGDLEYGMVGNRVAMFLHLCVTALDSKFELIVGNTHLTFPHDEWDNSMRLEQSRKLVDRSTHFAEKWGVRDLLLVGDFNGEDDNVTQHLDSLGFHSAAADCDAEAKVTHFNHRGEACLTDYVFFRPSSSLRAAGSSVLPEGVSTDSWPEEWSASDHRPVLCGFSFLKV